MDTKDIEDQVEQEALDLYFQGIHKRVLSSVLVPLVVVAVMWSQIDHVLLIAWALLMSAGIVAKHFLAAAYLGQHTPYTDTHKWKRRAGSLTFYQGVLWALSMLLFFVDATVEQKIFLIALNVTFAASAPARGIYWFPLYYLYAAPIVGGLVMRFLMQGGLPYIALAALFLLSFILMLPVARRLNAFMYSEMRLRHEAAQLSKELQSKTREAENAVLTKSKFLAAASHDLRQPLHALSLFVDVLRETKTDAERAIVFSRIELSLDALRKLFDALLDVSRLDAKVVEPEIGHLDVRALLQSLAEEFRADAVRKGIDFRVHAGSLVGISDPLLLERILRNLISNAIRYTDSGGVLLSARPRAGRVLLQVWDTGIGIPEESREVVFEEFHQLHNAHRDRTEGLGLGLALVKRLCRLLNHPLALCSRPGRGSVFGITLPRGMATHLPHEDNDVPAHKWDLTARQILVIDDEREILDAMQVLLSKWGCEVITAESLGDAITQLERKGMKPELVLSDLRLREDKTGVEAINGIRVRFGEAIRGILVTGDTNPDQIKRAKESGYELLQKPVRPAHLRMVMRHHLPGGA